MKIGYYYCVIAVYILLLFWDYTVIHSILYGNGFAKIGLALSLIPTVILTIFLIRNYPKQRKDDKAEDSVNDYITLPCFAL